MNPNNIIMKKNSLIAIALLIISIAGYWYWTTTPSYSLGKIKSSIENHDITTFKEYVDIETLTSRFIDDALETSLESVGNNDGLSSDLSNSMVQLIKPRINEIVKEKISRFVENRTTDSEDINNEATQRLNFDVGSIFNAKLEGPNSIDRDGKIAYMSFDFYNSTYDTTLLVIPMFRDTGSHWTLIEISNAKSILETINSIQEQERLADDIKMIFISIATKSQGFYMKPTVLDGGGRSFNKVTFDALSDYRSEYTVMSDYVAVFNDVYIKIQNVKNDEFRLIATYKSSSDTIIEAIITPSSTDFIYSE